MFPGNNKLYKFAASVYHKPFLFPVADLRGAEGDSAGQKKIC